MAAALKAGIPQQIIPFSVDQPFWADRLYKLGYGLRPLKAKQISSQINEEKGNERVVEYLEELRLRNVTF